MLNCFSISSIAKIARDCYNENTPYRQTEGETMMEAGIMLYIGCIALRDYARAKGVTETVILEIMYGSNEENSMEPTYKVRLPV